VAGEADSVLLRECLPKDWDVAEEMLGELLSRDPAVWLEHLALSPGVQSPTMVYILATAIREEGEVPPELDRMQILGVAEALADMLPEQFGKTRALQELWTSRGIVFRERGQFGDALAALDRAALFVEGGYESLLDRSGILLMKASVHLEAGQYRPALVALVDSFGDYEEPEDREERLTLLWQIIDAIERKGRQ
jgi:hypothetical protein